MNSPVPGPPDIPLDFLSLFPLPLATISASKGPPGAGILEGGLCGDPRQYPGGGGFEKDKKVKLRFSPLPLHLPYPLPPPLFRPLTLRRKDTHSTTTKNTNQTKNFFDILRDYQFALLPLL